MKTSRNRILLMAWAAGAAAFLACSSYGDEEAEPGPLPPALRDAEPEGDDGAADAAPDVQLPPLPLPVKQVAMGEDFGCALLEDGTVACWGDNQYGELGLPPARNLASPPVRVPGLGDVASIAAGYHSACVVKNDGTVWCWGLNSRGELGHVSNVQNCGNVHCEHVPQLVPGVTALTVTVGTRQACALTTTKRVMCWGRNSEGQSGLSANDAAASSSVAPREVEGVSDVTAVRLGYLALTACALDAAGMVRCWGLNDYGQLGHEPGTSGDLVSSAGPFNPAPSLVKFADGGVFDRVVDVITSQTVCAVRADGSVWCWGGNRGNQLVFSGPDDAGHPSPVRIPNIVDARRLAAGSGFCALRAGGQALCWGPTRLANGSTFYLADCLTPAGSAIGCRDPAPLIGPPLRDLDLDESSGVALPLDESGPLAWGSNVDGRLGHPRGTQGDDAGFNATLTPVVGLP